MKRLLAVFGVAAVAMIAAFRFAGWYADTSALPRYCDNPRATVAHVERILTEAAPAGEAARRPYLVAAKLIFLVPQRDGEPDTDYLDRLFATISERCRAAF